jgi:hypothetical protein
MAESGRNPRLAAKQEVNEESAATFDDDEQEEELPPHLLDRQQRLGVVQAERYEAKRRT